jgi:ATP-dependent protease ClpP protease subunit
VTGWWSFDEADGVAHLEVTGEIGAAADELVDLLGLVVADRIDLFVDSPGGNVRAALLVAAALAGHPAPVVSQIGRRAGSAASLLVLAGDRRRIHPHGQVTLHEPAGDGGDPEPLADFMAEWYALRTGGRDDTPDAWRRRCDF